MQPTVSEKPTEQAPEGQQHVFRDPTLGRLAARGGVYYRFTYVCPECDLDIGVNNYFYEEKICGQCNCKLRMSKVAK